MPVIREFPEDLAAYDGFLDKAYSHDRDTADIERAIEIAESLVHRCPDDAEAHYLLGLAWYHFPASSSLRSWRSRRSLERAVEIDPFHQFALQYLAYLAFDQERYADALAFQSRISAAYFMDRDLEWRALKNLETTNVCRIRLSPDCFPAAQFEEFVCWYRDAQRREDQDLRSGSFVLPQELRECAEWLFEIGAPLSDSRLKALLAFLAEIGYTDRIRSPLLRSHAAVP